MNMKFIGAAVLAGAMVAGCGKKTEETVMEDGVVLKVNGFELKRSAVEGDIAAVIKAQGDSIPSNQLEYARQMIRQQIVQGFIAQKVLLEKAKAEGFVVTDDDRKEKEAELLKALARQPGAPKTVAEYFKSYPFGEDRARSEFENGILIDKMIKDAQTKASAVDYKAKAEEIISTITSNNAKVATADADALKKIKDIKASLDKVPAAELAVKFAEAAKENSECPSSAKGGDLGPFTRGAMVPEFDKAAFTLPVGKLSEPIKTQFGYHLLLVTSKTPEVKAEGDKPASPEKVQASHILVKVEGARPVPKLEDVVNSLKKEAERSFVQKFVLDEIGKAKIEALADDFKQFVPQKDDMAVENPAEK